MITIWIAFQQVVILVYYKCAEIVHCIVCSFICVLRREVIIEWPLVAHLHSASREAVIELADFP